MKPPVSTVIPFPKTLTQKEWRTFRSSFWVSIMFFILSTVLLFNGNEWLYGLLGLVIISIMLKVYHYCLPKSYKREEHKL